jgi:glycosyltransferase involved in cell wall biosynthesis
VKVSVIVPAFNEEKLLGDSLREIQSAAGAFAARGWGWELIVCDNNSTDRTADIARAAGATVIFEPVNQIARARNTGASIATGDWFVFVDADSHPGAELFADVAEEISSGKYLAGGSTVRMDAPGFTARFLTSLWCWISRVGRLMAGSFIFVEAAAFRKIGGFSHELFAAEEIDLSRRLKVLGKEAGRGLVILHRHPLKTSARKLKLYSTREILVFSVKTIFCQRRMLASRERAHLWYDGRR